MIESSVLPQRRIERPQTILLTRPERPSPRAARERDRVFDVARMRGHLRGNHGFVLGPKSFDIRAGLGGKFFDLPLFQLANALVVQLKTVLVNEQANKGVVILK